MKFLVQGDVVFKKLDKLPEGYTMVEQDVKIIQQSEITGHHHQFRDKGADLYHNPDKVTDVDMTITPNLGKLLVVREPITLYHGKKFEVEPHKTGTGDHDAMVLDPGIYEIDITREYSEDEIVRVRD